MLVLSNSRGVFRCDTFVYYLFAMGGYNLPVSTIINPTRIFYSFPSGNGDGPYSPELRANSNDFTNELSIGLEGYSDSELSSMSMDNFYRIVDIPNDKIDQKTQNRLFNLVKNNELLSSSRKSMILDKLSFVGEIRTISELIDLFEELDEENSSLKNQVITTVQRVFEHQCSKIVTPQCNVVKKKLVSFYNDLVQKQIQVTPKNASLIVRSVINLSGRDKIMNAHEEINH